VLFRSNIYLKSICPSHESILRGEALHFILKQCQKENENYKIPIWNANITALPEILKNDPRIPRDFDNYAYRTAPSEELQKKQNTLYAGFETCNETEKSHMLDMLDEMIQRRLTHPLNGRTLTERHYALTVANNFKNVPSLNTFFRREKGNSVLVDCYQYHHFAQDYPYWRYLSSKSIEKLTESDLISCTDIPELSGNKTADYRGLLACIPYNDHYVALCNCKKYK
jgi:hypothetical protein